MRILIVSHYFPPYQTIGAMRMGKLAKFWHQKGYDVRVISAANQALPKTLALEIPSENVVYAFWPFIKPLITRTLRQLLPKPNTTPSHNGATPASSGPSLKQRLAFAYRTVTNIPDGFIGWYPGAVWAGRRLLKQWKPHFIVASAPPNTCLLVANTLSQEFGIPWVADLRDLWMDDPHRAIPMTFPKWRDDLESRLERAVLGKAMAMVTVSQPLVQTLRGKFANPAMAILNGFDPSDYSQDVAMPTSGPLVVRYLGSLYQWGTDPSPLLAALQLLQASAAQVRLEFFAPPQFLHDSRGLEANLAAYQNYVKGLAARFGVEGLVQVMKPVPYREALRLQQQADVLLLLLRDHPSEEGVFTGKVFDYVGASRPILAIGSANNVAIKLVQERGLGLASQDPGQIAQWLQGLLQQKANGGIANLPPGAKVGLSRNEQFEQMERFIVGLLGEH